MASADALRQFDYLSRRLARIAAEVAAAARRARQLKAESEAVHAGIYQSRQRWRRSRPPAADPRH